MRRKHGGRESGVGMLNQRGERDRAISTAEKKSACQDKAKHRQREKEIRGQLDILKNDGEAKASKYSDEEQECWRVE